MVAVGGTWGLLSLSNNLAASISFPLASLRISLLNKLGEANITMKLGRDGAK